MSENTEKILAEALDLPPIERAALIEEHLSSFEFPTRKSIDALWAEEAENRIDAYEQNKLGTTPAKEVFEKISRK